MGSIPLSKLTSLDLQKLYKILLAEGRIDRIESKNQPNGLSAKTVRNINQIISSALNLAKEQKLISSNPAEACALPKVEHREMKTLPVEQLISFLREAKESGVYEMYYIELATGLRRGELLGLKWDDIDMTNGTIRVQRQVARIDGEIVEAPLKTKNSYRTVSIGDDAIEVLKEQRKKVGREIEYVFPSPNGGPISPDSVLNMFHRVLERAGLPKIRFHACGTPSQHWLCRTAWTSKRYPVCWDISPPDLPSIPTLMSQPLHRKKRQIPWEVSCEWRQTAKPQRMDTKI